MENDWNRNKSSANCLHWDVQLQCAQIWHSIAKCGPILFRWMHRNKYYLDTISCSLEKKSEQPNKWTKANTNEKDLKLLNRQISRDIDDAERPSCKVVINDIVRYCPRYCRILTCQGVCLRFKLNSVKRSRNQRKSRFCFFFSFSQFNPTITRIRAVLIVSRRIQSHYWS